MKVKSTVLFLSLIFTALFSSCSSLPLPGSSTESLFIMAGEVDKRLGTNREGRSRTIDRIMLTLENLDTGKTKSITYMPNKKYISLPLEPGRYSFKNKITITVSESPGGSWTNDKNISVAPFLVKESTVFVSNIVFKVSSDNRGWFNISTYSSTSNSNVIRKKAVDEVFNERRFKAWELYQVVGWDTEEE